MRSIRSYLGQQGRSRWGHRRLSEKGKKSEILFPHTFMPLPGQARIHTCPPVDDSGHRHCGIASDDGHHMGTGGGGGEEQEEVGQGVYTVCTTKHNVWRQIWECQVTRGRGGVCMCM